MKNKIKNVSDAVKLDSDTFQESMLNLLEDLKESEENYRLLFENANDVILQIDNKGVIINVNNKIKEMIGYEPKEIIGRHVSKTGALSLKNIVYILKLLTEAVRTKKTEKVLQLDLKHKNGQLVSIETSSQPLIKKGKVIGFIAIIRDVTERNKVQERLIQSEEKYRSLYQSSQDGFVIVDMSGKIKEFNHAYARMLGYDYNELFKKTYVELTPKKWHDFEAKIVKEQVLKRGYSDFYQKEYRKKDGAIIPIELKTYLIRDSSNKPAAMWAFIKDITESKKAEESLKLSEERFRLLFENAGEGIVYINNKGTIIDINPEILKITGLKYEDLAGKSIISLAGKYKLDSKEILKNFKSLVSTGSFGKTEWLIKTPASRSVWIKANAELIRVGGKITGLVATIEDVTESKKAQEKIAEAQKRFEELVEQSPFSYEVYDSKGLLVQVNKAYEMLWSSERKKAVNLFNILKDKDASNRGLLPYIKRAYQGENINLDSHEYDHHFMRCNIYPIKSIKNEVTNVVVISEDITEIVKNQGELEKFKKEDEVNKMRKDFLLLITHELKQPLTPIMGYADLLKEEIVDVEKLKYLDRIINGSEEMYELITKIINLMRIETGQLMFTFSKIESKKLLNEALNKKASLINLRNIEIKKEIKDFVFNGDYNLLRDVLVNLIDNAVKFSEPGSPIEVYAKQDKKHSIIKIRDHGQGISPQEIPNLFKTFSQTLEGRKRGGFGIGLSLCKMIMEKHNGDISVESEKGKGSTFIIKIPRRVK